MALAERQEFDMSEISELTGAVTLIGEKVDKVDLRTEKIEHMILGNGEPQKGHAWRIAKLEEQRQQSEQLDVGAVVRFAKKYWPILAALVAGATGGAVGDEVLFGKPQAQQPPAQVTTP